MAKLSLFRSVWRGACSLTHAKQRPARRTLAKVDRRTGAFQRAETEMLWGPSLGAAALERKLRNNARIYRFMVSRARCAVVVFYANLVQKGKMTLAKNFSLLAAQHQAMS